MKHTTTILSILIFTAMFSFTACQLLTEYAPPLDWPNHPQEQVEDTCNTTDFITGFLEFDTPQDSVLWQGGGTSSYELGDVLNAVWPGHPYKIYRTPKAYMVIVEGTGDHNFAQLKVFCRADGAKWYMGWAARSILPMGTLTPSNYADLIELYPKMDRFNFRGTNYDSITYVNLANAILADCIPGGVWADFRFNQHPIPLEVVQAFEDAGWETVLY